MIGVFDSGFGGLNVLRGITTQLPQYGYIYLGDSARAPYGSRPFEEVYMFTKQGVEFLFEHGATLIVLACNTASSEALRKIQSDYEKSPNKKVLGVLIPFAESAVAQTDNKRVGVIATEGTVRSGSFVREIQKLDDKIYVVQQACPLLVPLIEAGEMKATDSLLRDYLAPLLADGIDTLILGCTHYGLLETQVRAVVGPDIAVVSERDVVPASLEVYLERHPDIEIRITKNVAPRFYSTGPLDRFEQLGSMFFRTPLHAERATLG